MDLNLVWAALAGAVLGSLAEWLFAGLLVRGRPNLHPQASRRGPDPARLAAALALALVTSAAFVLLANKIGQTDLRGGLKLAAMIWLIGPLPLLAANAVLIGIDPPAAAASHAAGWLAKLLLIGAATAWFLP